MLNRTLVYLLNEYMNKTEWLREARCITGVSIFQSSSSIYFWWLLNQNIDCSSCFFWSEGPLQAFPSGILWKEPFSCSGCLSHPIFWKHWTMTVATTKRTENCSWFLFSTEQNYFDWSVDVWVKNTNTAANCTFKRHDTHLRVLAPTKVISTVSSPHL